MSAQEAFDSTAPPRGGTDFAFDEPGAENVMTLRVHGGGAHTGEVPSGFEGFDTHVLDAAPKARLSEEERLEREVARRRQLELERRVRIFDAKRRTIGIDKDFLDQQCAEKAERQRLQAEAQRAEDREFMGVNRVLALAELDKNRLRKAGEKEAKEFSLQNLNFASRREFDLNDPKAVTRSLAARIGDEDPRCGPSSMQQFNGEDLMGEERVRQQRLATVHAVEQQKFEKEMLRRAHAGDDAIFAQQTQDITDLRNEVEASEHALRREMLAANQAELKQRIEANAEKQRIEAETNQDLNAKELEHHATDLFLQESRPPFRPDGQLAKDLYKGATRTERMEVLNMQLAQCEENAKRRAHEGAQQNLHHQHVELTRRQLVMMEREKQRMRRAMATEVAMHNKGTGDVQKEQAKLLVDAHKNQYSPEFFEQYGQHTR